jgi:hypothetical protein
MLGNDAVSSAPLNPARIDCRAVMLFEFVIFPR